MLTARRAIAVPAPTFPHANLKPVLDAIRQAAWFVALYTVIPDFHHPIRQALRNAGIEKHTTLAKW